MDSEKVVLYDGEKRTCVMLSGRQVAILSYAWRTLRLYYMARKYTYTCYAKEFILSNQMLQPGETEITVKILQVFIFWKQEFM
jgi:hypothetical protein